MTEYALLALSWYGIGLLSMLVVQCWIDKLTVDERKTWPHHKPNPDIGAQEVWVLGLLGPIISAIAIYFVVVIWWLRRQE